VTNFAFDLVLFGGFFAAMIVCLEAGRRMGHKAFGTDDLQRPSGLGAVEAVAFGLLGLLLAFSFSGAAERLDARRAQIVEEANDIETAWLLIDLVPANAQPKLRDAFRQYTDSRIAVYRAFSHAGLESAKVEFAHSIALQYEIWTKAVGACRDVPHANIVLLPALSRMFEIATTRLAATQMHPPTIVFVVLAVISLVCAFLVGYGMGATEVPSRPHMVVFALIVSFTLYVILDFEYPRMGLIRIDDFDQLIVHVRAFMG